MFCRVAAKELSLLTPQLAQAGVRLIGIGLEEIGVEEFIAGKFFDGELYIDSDKKSFKALNYKKLGFLNMVPALLSRVAREAVRKGKEWAVGGDMKGDGFQNGGLLVVALKGEKVLYEFKQENPADHAENSAIVKALGLEEVKQTQEVDRAQDGTNVTDLECEEVCAMPPKK
ncbi:prostamide/prostaglandin F synthase-like [Homarus americanus]|uniref:Prostamide/prostaglandin F synthase n=1 Tax=Homarus americanus TaxID=6706 RepID=A0A8J5T730_HOMAM|nr:prostamide/prostaglandin F synthase-like [Homarus americanus]KAG7172875.1 Prostamide/prostaglandin F synthase-like [Homarus americanus]